MRTTVYDCIIIGAGPAGATLARLLGRERSVLLLDARSFTPSGFTREKCCGGLLAPDAARQLRSLGLVLPDSLRGTSQPLTVRALDLHSAYDRRYPRRYVNLDRQAFEAWLLSLLPEEVTFLAGACCRDIRRNRGLWEVSVAGKSVPAATYASRFVVGAEGAASLVRRRLDPAHAACPKYFAVQDVFERFGGCEAGSSEYAAFFHPLFTDFYGWVIPKNDRVLLGAALPPRVTGAYNVEKRMSALRRALADAGYEFDGRIRREACLLVRPRPGDIFHGAYSAFCVGEAAGFISPSSAEGFSYAFASARALAGAVLAGKNGEATLTSYKRATLPLALNIVWKTLKSYGMYTPPLRRLIMRSGILATRK